jgi:hypothetical protein
MTPKQKAKELILKYYFVYVSGYTSIHEVKRAALIAVDEIIESVNDEHVSDIFIEFWEDVKTEIENL